MTTTLLLVYCIAVSSGQYLQISPGSMSQALGTIRTVVDEGLTAFHNPALASRTECCFVLSRYLYGTTQFAGSGTYKNSSLGLYYLNYGTIQGYDAYGFETDVFTPYSLELIAGRKIGPVSFHVKGFMETISSYTMTGICGGVAAYHTFGGITMGLKVDNIGKIIGKDIDIPIITALGSRITLPVDTDLYVEVRGFPIEGSSGVAYTYENITLLAGVRYVTPETCCGPEVVFSTEDLHFSAGVQVRIENYRIGYGFVYSTFSSAHHFSIGLIP